ncbi:glutathione S-transferase theta-3-like [Ambystoma mexicanum]|uniref:glutathione S-transferase theta-3-like n=1 Tax=Ambystoma mexicanum TaxID=8296 RepID=UPI0037E737C0
MLQLYLDLLSQPCRSVYIFAKQNNIDFEFKQVHLFKGEHHSGELKSVNPLRKVPALKDGDFTLAESIAILLYMSRKYKTPDHWYPEDLQKRAQVDEYLSWQHTAVRAHGSRVFWCKAMAPVLLGTETDPERMAAVIKDLNGTLDQFEAKFLQDKPYIVAHEISLADLVAVVELMQPVAAGIDIFKDRPKLDAWRERVEAALGTELFQEAHQAILNITKVKREPLEPHVAEALKAKLHLFK